MYAVALRRLRSSLRALALLVLSLVLLVVAGSGGVRWWLASDAGGRALRAQLLESLGSTLSGRFELDGVATDGERLTLRGLRVFTPEGELVLDCPELEASVDLRALVEGVAKLRDVTVRAPRLHLVRDERGFNLARALEPRLPAGQKPASGGPARFELRAVEVGRLGVTDASIDFTDGPRRLGAASLHLDGRARVTLEPFAVEGSLGARSPRCEPGPGPCSLTLVARSAAPGAVALDVEAAVGESQVKGQLHWPELEARSLELRVAPAQARALVPEWPVLVPLVLRGDLSSSQGRLMLTDGGSTSLRADGRWDVAARSITELRIDAAIDGATARVEGAGDKSGLTLDGRATVVDAARVRTSVALLLGVRLPDGALQGRFRVRLSGPVAGPSLRLDGRLTGLRAASVSAESADVDVRVPDLTRPLQTSGSVDVRGLAMGGSRLDRVGLELETSGRDVRVTAVASALTAVRVELAALVDGDQQGARLDALRLEDGERSWSLEAPSTVSWRAGRLSVGPIGLRSEGQRLTWAGGWADERSMSGRLGVEGLRLEALPPLVRAYTASARGRLDAEVSMEGPWSRLAGRARAQLREASLGELHVKEARLSVDGSSRDGARGQLTADSTLGAIKAVFTVPAVWTKAGRGAPVAVEAEGDGLDLSTALALAKLERALTGRVAWRATASGSLATPTLDVDVRSEQLTYQAPRAGSAEPLAARDVRVKASLSPAAPLGASLSGMLFGGAVEGTLTTGLTFERLAAGGLTVGQARALFRELRVDLSELRLEALDRAGLLGAVAPAEDELGSGGERGAPRSGALSLRLAASGPLDAPAIAARATLTDVAIGPLRRLSGQVALDGDDGGVRGRVVTTEDGAPFAELDFDLSAPLAALESPGRLTAAPLRLEARLHPTPVERLRPPGRADALVGTASATLAVGGTLDALRVELDGGVEGLGLDGLQLGRASLRLASDGGSQHVAVDLIQGGGVALSVRGAVQQRLGLAVLVSPSAAADAGISLTVEANDFDVSLFSGLSDSVRALEGRVSVRGAVAGTVARPRLTGEARWRGGRAVVRGVGDVRGIEADVTSDGDTLELTRLVARSGAGSLELAARAQRLPSGSFRLELDGSTRRWPVLRDDQLLALVSASLRGSASAGDGLVDFSALEIARAEVDLPELLRKDLQDLERPGDVIVVRRGAPGPRGRRAGAGAAASPANPSDPAPVADQPGEAAWRFRARCTAPRNLWLKSSDVKLELGLSEGFLVEYSDSLSLSGRASIHRGRLNVIGREFEVVEGAHARFAGPASRPFISAQAQYLHEQDGDRIRVTVAVNGRGSDLAFKVSSEPPLPESEIYTLLATGRRALRRGGSASVTPEQAVSAIGSVAATALKTALAKELPVDVLNLEAADGFSGVADLKVDVGKYLSDALFLGFSVQPGARPERGESHYKGRLEFQLSRDVSAEAWAGTAPAMGAGVVWSREY